MAYLLGSIKYAWQRIHAGLVTQSAKKGVCVEDIMCTSGNCSTETVHRYNRKAGRRSRFLKYACDVLILRAGVSRSLRSLLCGQMGIWVESRADDRKVHMTLTTLKEFHNKYPDSTLHSKRSDYLNQQE